MRHGWSGERQDTELLESVIGDQAGAMPFAARSRALQHRPRVPWQTADGLCGGAQDCVDAARMSTAAIQELLVEVECLRNEVREYRRREEPECLPKATEDSLHVFWHRALWLVGLLLCQSTSSLILEWFDPLLQRHPVVLYFLTMLVGAGGNAGGQSTVLVVRKLALGRAATGHSCWRLVAKQLGIGLRLAAILAAASLLRCWLFEVVGREALAICISMFVIVVTSTLLGAALPLIFKNCGADPAHAGAAIQVLMDITGVTLTCFVACLVLGVPIFAQVHAATYDQPIQIEETRARRVIFGRGISRAVQAPP